MWTDTGDSRASYQQQLFTPTDGTVNVGHNDKLSASYHGTVSLFLQISLQQTEFNHKTSPYYVYVNTSAILGQWTICLKCSSSICL